MNMVSDPIVVAYDDLTVDEKKPAVRHDRLAHPLQKIPEFVVGCRDHSRQGEFRIVVVAALYLVAEVARQRVLECY